MKNKNFLFCLFLLITSAHTAFAQRTISPGTTKQVEKLPASLKNLFQRAGFDTQASTAAENRSELVLDSTKTFYGYIGTDSTPLFRTVYTYPGTNVREEVNSEFFGEWYYTSRATTTTDNQQRILEVHAETFDQGTQTWVDDSRLLVYPHGNSENLIDSFFAYVWNPDVSDWALLLKGTNFFDAQDRQTESLNYIFFSGTELIFREIFEYDANGDNNRIEEFALIGGVDYPSSLLENTHFNHLLTEAVASVHDGFEYIPQSKATFSYTNFGAIEQHYSEEWNSDSLYWKPTQAIFYDYDAQQRLEGKALTFIYDDFPNEFELTIYTYVEDENLATETIYLANADNPAWILDMRTHYYYNGTTTVTPITRNTKKMDVSPNPTTGRFFTALDAEAEVRVFNASGKLLKSMVVQPGQQVDISNLPAGMYYLTAQKELEVYTGKVVKQ